MSITYSEEFIKEIPKSDLHVHLDGSLRLDTLIELAKQENVKMPSYTEDGLRKEVFKDKYKNLGDYLHGFAYTCAVLRTPENLERCSYELAIDNQREGVRYFEVRFAPQLLMNNKDMTMEVVFESVHKGLDRAKKEFNSRKEVMSGEEPPFNCGMIACAMRMFGPKGFSPYYTRFFEMHQYARKTEVIKAAARELVKGAVKIRDERGLPIVGFDLAGQEDGYPADNFAKAYHYAHKHFLHKTVHAGEAYGAESIFQAITDLHADRIGHGFYLFDKDKIFSGKVEDKEIYLRKLASYIADKRVTLEVCLTSNMQTNPGITSIKDHSVQMMLDKRISTAFCTDNRLISNTTMSKELKLALDNFIITPTMFKNIVAYGFKRSFYPGSYLEKRKYAVQVMKYYTKIADKHGIGRDIPPKHENI